MNRKQNFQRLLQTNPKLFQMIRSKYYSIHFCEYIEEEREEQELDLVIRLTNMRENAKSMWSIL